MLTQGNGSWKFFDGSYVIVKGGTSIARSCRKVMSLPLRTPTPPPVPRDEFAGIEDLDRTELDEFAPDTDPMLVPLDWDGDNESGIVPRRR